MYTDSHCHLQLLDYAKLGTDMTGVVQNAIDNQVGLLLCVCTHLDQVPDLRAIADDFVNVKISIGLHPNEEISHEPSMEDYLLAQAHADVVAIGETGLDYYRGADQKSLQQDRFRVQIRAAKQCDKPLIVHTRDARKDTIDILRDEHAETVGGVMHCFTEDWEMAQQAIDLNFYISFSGIVSFANAKPLQEVAKLVPLERMLIETDSPFLAPVPLRGQMNQPANVRYVAEFIANLKGVDVKTVAEQTTKNYKKLFKV
jgi:TatD DNase family protein